MPDQLKELDHDRLDAIVTLLKQADAEMTAMGLRVGYRGRQLVLERQWETKQYECCEFFAEIGPRHELTAEESAALRAAMDRLGPPRAIVLHGSQIRWSDEETTHTPTG